MRNVRSSTALPVKDRWDTPNLVRGRSVSGDPSPGRDRKDGRDMKAGWDWSGKYDDGDRDMMVIDQLKLTPISELHVHPELIRADARCDGVANH
eukprot:1353219-Amphidinium_carterae.1